MVVVLYGFKAAKKKPNEYNGHFVFQVGRAFSFNKTPSKLKRAVSTVISPLTSSAKLNRTQVHGHLGTPGDHTEYRPEVSHALFPCLVSLSPGVSA